MYINKHKNIRMNKDDDEVNNIKNKISFNYYMQKYYVKINAHHIMF